MLSSVCKKFGIVAQMSLSIKKQSDQVMKTLKISLFLLSFLLLGACEFHDKHDHNELTLSKHLASVLESLTP